MSAAHTGTTASCHGIDLINEHDTGRIVLRLFKQIAHTGCADTDEHFHEIRSGNAEKRYSGFACHGFRQQSLTGSGRSLQQNTLGNPRTDAGVFPGFFQKIDDFLQFLFFLLQTGYLCKGDALVTHGHFGPAFAKVHHFTVTATGLLGIHHHENEYTYSQYCQHRQHISKEPVLSLNVIHYGIKSVLANQCLQLGDIRSIQLMIQSVLHLDLQIAGRGFSIRLYYDLRYISGIQICDEFCSGIVLFPVAQQIESYDHHDQKYDKNKIRINCSAVLFQLHGPPTSSYCLIEFYHTDVRQITISLIIIQTVAHYKFIGNIKSGIIYMNIDDSSLRLVQQSAQT